MEGFASFPDKFIRIYKEKGYWEDITFGEHLEFWVKQHADSPAIGYQGREITYSQMDEYATRLAYQLIHLGIKTYDPIIIQLFNIPELVYLIYACFKIGAIPICTLATHRWTEISFLAKESDAVAHVIPGAKVKNFDYQKFAEDVRMSVPSLKYILTLGKSKGTDVYAVDDFLKSEIDLNGAKSELANYRPDPMKPALFQLSGGTTGVPKIIARTHNDYYYNAKCIAKALEYDPNFRLLVTTPLIHNAALINCLLPLHSKGGTIVLSESLAPQSLLSALAVNKVNTALLFGVQMHRILAHFKKMKKKSDLSSFKRVMGIWNPYDRELQEFFEVFHCEGVQSYGMTEGLVCWTRWNDPTEIRHFTQGRPVSEADETRIVDINIGETVADGEIGEMQCRGPYTIRGYFKAPERNKEAFTHDGFYRTGDLVRKDGRGNFIWSGRIKDCIDRGGEKINAEEIEDHILNFPKVKQVAIVGMPDKEMGERICAFVVPKPDETFSLVELSEFLVNERKIAKFKVPERLEFTDDLPVTKVGKFEKKSLRDKIAEILKSEGRI